MMTIKDIDDGVIIWGTSSALAELVPSLLSLALLRNTWSSSPKSAVERSTPSPIADCTSDTWGQLTFMLCHQEWLAIQITSLERVCTNTLCKKNPRHDFRWFWDLETKVLPICGVFCAMAGCWMDPAMAIGEPMVVWYPGIQSSDFQQSYPSKRPGVGNRSSLARGHIPVACTTMCWPRGWGRVSTLKKWLSCH